MTAQDGGTFEDMPLERRIRLQEEANDLMPKGWGAPGLFFDKFLKAKGIKRAKQLTTDQVVNAQEGDKLPPVETKETTPLMNFFKHMIPGFRLAYKQKQLDLTKDPGFVKTPQQTAVRDSGFVKTPIIKKPIPQDKGFFKMPSLVASKRQEGGLMIPNLGISPITR